MTLTLVPPSRVPHEWDAIRACLTPALERGKQSSWKLLSELLTGASAVFRVGGSATGYVVAFSAYPKGSAILTLWVWLVSGQVNGGPRERVRNMRELLTEIEQIASKSKCKRVRVEGRAEWRHVLKGYAEIGRDGDKVIFERGV